MAEAKAQASLDKAEQDQGAVPQAVKQVAEATAEAGNRCRNLHGIASTYGDPQPTASGEKFNPAALTAAHRTLPFGTLVRITNQHNGRTVLVRINDRGPYIPGRIIDLSTAAARSIGMGNGLAPVTLQACI